MLVQNHFLASTTICAADGDFTPECGSGKCSAVFTVANMTEGQKLPTIHLEDILKIILITREKMSSQAWYQSWLGEDSSEDHEQDEIDVHIANVGNAGFDDPDVDAQDEFSI